MKGKEGRISVDLKAIPSETLMNLVVQPDRIFHEAWGDSENEVSAIRTAIEGLHEGQQVLIDLETRKGERVCGMRRLDMFEFKKGRLDPNAMVLLVIARK